MALFPELDGMPLSALLAHFSSDDRYHTDLAERELWLQEMAVRIAKSGTDGLTFLLWSIPNADQAKVRAILLSVSFLPSEIANDRRGELRDLLLTFLESKDPALIAEAIEGLNSHGFTEMLQDVVSFLNHPSPYVVGSAIRYLSSLYPEKAEPILLESLKSKESIVRQTAIDELDRLELVEALPNLHPLLQDEDKHVRQAARTAIVNLLDARRKR